MIRTIAIIVLMAAASLHGDVTAFVGVNVLPMDGERRLLGQTVIVRDDRIEAIGPMSDVAVPPDARVIYGRGRWLMPGLIDAHVHILAADLPRYLESGVTTVRDLAGLDSVMVIARRVARGELRGPRIIAASLLMNGPNPGQPFFSVVVPNAAAAPAAVDRQLARGSTWIKLYENLPRDVYEAIVAAARSRGARVAGHVTASVSVLQAMTLQDSIEHLAGYDRAVTERAGSGGFAAWIDVDHTRFPALAEASRESGVWNCPTLHIYEVLTSQWDAADRERMLANRRSFVRALHEAGARIVTGTDAGYLAPAGAALHEEFQELLKSGLTAFEVLEAATRAGAELLGMDDEIGTVAVGMRADLLLATEPPDEELETLRRPAGVMVGGQWTSFERRRAVRP